jgi:hypothetical protein
LLNKLQNANIGVFPENYQPVYHTVQYKWWTIQIYLVTSVSGSLCVQTGSGAHPASCTMGTVAPFPGAIAAGAWRWPLTPSSAEVENE